MPSPESLASVVDAIKRDTTAEVVSPEIWMPSRTELESSKDFEPLLATTDGSPLDLLLENKCLFTHAWILQCGAKHSLGLSFEC